MNPYESPQYCEVRSNQHWKLVANLLLTLSTGSNLILILMGFTFTDPVKYSRDAGFPAIAVLNLLVWMLAAFVQYTLVDKSEQNES